MLFCDIGNSGAKFYDGERVWRVARQELPSYATRRVCYVCVDPEARRMVEGFATWIDLAPLADLASRYRGLGDDRRVLCSYFDDGVVVDAGSAITVDVMERGEHLGGFIYPGLGAMERAYGSISPALEVAPRFDSLHTLPLDTRDAIGYGILAPLVCQIERYDKDVYITGGDGVLLGRYIEGASYDPLYLFRAMQRIAKRNRLC